MWLYSASVSLLNSIQSWEDDTTCKQISKNSRSISPFDGVRSKPSVWIVRLYFTVKINQKKNKNKRKKKRWNVDVSFWWIALSLTSYAHSHGPDVWPKPNWNENTHFCLFSVQRTHSIWLFSFYSFGKSTIIYLREKLDQAKNDFTEREKIRRIFMYCITFVICVRSISRERTFRSHKMNAQATHIYLSIASICMFFLTFVLHQTPFYMM